MSPSCLGRQRIAARLLRSVLPRRVTRKPRCPCGFAHILRVRMDRASARFRRSLRAVRERHRLRDTATDRNAQHPPCDMRDDARRVPGRRQPARCCFRCRFAADHRADARGASRARKPLRPSRTGVDRRRSSRRSPNPDFLVGARLLILANSRRATSVVGADADDLDRLEREGIGLAAAEGPYDAHLQAGAARPARISP